MPVGTVTPNDPDDTCYAAEEGCQLCPAESKGDEEDFPECLRYGRRQRWECSTSPTFSGGGTVSTKKSYGKYSPCPTTATDLSNGFWRFQFYMFLLGGSSLWGVRRETVRSSSLFDRRKRGDYTPVKLRNPFFGKKKNGDDGQGFGGGNGGRDEETVSFLTNRNNTSEGRGEGGDFEMTEV